MAEIATKNYPATAKVLVRSENMSRTALGIAHAYLLINPNSTIDDLNRAFPREQLKQSSPLFLDKKGRSEYIAAHGGTEKALSTNYFYEEQNAMLKLKNGEDVAVLQMWTGEKFPLLVEWAKKHDIYVAEFTKGSKGKLGFFELEYLNNWKPVIIKKKYIPWWVWLILGLLILGVLAVILFKPKPETKVVTVVDTVYAQQLEKIEDNFNAAEFEQGKADLSDEAKFVLHDLGKLMKQYPELKLRIEGHTSAEGEASVNQKLSMDRAQAAVTFLVEHEGVENSRLQAAGFGSSKLKNTADPMAAENRRTEFEVIK
jgi:flagellar motor protein MotB